MKDYYAILEVHPSASAKVIAAAYRELSKSRHPDAGGSAEKFRELKEAYETLKNPEARRQYDLAFSGRNGHTQPPPNPPGGAHKVRRWVNGLGFVEMDAEEVAGFPGTAFGGGPTGYAEVDELARAAASQVGHQIVNLLIDNFFMRRR